LLCPYGATKGDLKTSVAEMRPVELSQPRKLLMWQKLAKQSASLLWTRWTSSCNRSTSLSRARGNAYSEEFSYKYPSGRCLYTACFTTLGHNYRRWFTRSLWSKQLIETCVRFWTVTELWPLSHSRTRPRVNSVRWHLLETQSQTTNKKSPNIRCLGWDSNRVPPEFKPDVGLHVAMQNYVTELNPK
jgi:hypothetical protein